VVAHSPGDIAAVAVLRPTAFRLEAKDGAGAADLHDAEVVEVPAGASVQSSVRGHQLKAQAPVPPSVSHLSIAIYQSHSQNMAA
jgi:hypothetical protein